MSDKKLTGHGRIICEKCGKLIASCRCIKSADNTYYDVCNECKSKGD